MEESELSMLLEDIMSLERERRDLLKSLTPTISLWEWEDTISTTTTTTSRVAQKGIMEENTSPVSIEKKMESLQVRDDDTEFINYFDFILQDTLPFGHRMLSMSQFLSSSSHVAISSYKGQDLVRTASKLMKISEDLCKDAVAAVEDTTEDKVKDDEDKEMMLSNEFLRLSCNVLEKPHLYRNELAMMFTEEEEKEYEMEMEREREKVAAAERERKQWRQRRRQQQQKIVVEQATDEQQETESPMEHLQQLMDNELGYFASCRRYWESTNGSKTGHCGGFQDKTTLSSMQFTHCTPSIIPTPAAAVIGTTLQIYSFKIVELRNNLKWPLYVYGVVAARDTVDRNRNLLFHKSRFRWQVLTENDSSLCLIGPSRAILAEDPVDFEVELKLVGEGDESTDIELMNVTNCYDGGQQALYFNASLCKAELSLETVPRAVQATILSVRVGKGRWPFECGGRVACSLYSAEVGNLSCGEVVLLDSVEKIPEDELDGYLPLSRKVVSVDIQGGLKVGVQSYGGSNGGSGFDVAYFPSQYCNISQGRCLIFGIQVEITVAWSRLVRDKMDMLIEGYATQA